MRTQKSIRNIIFAISAQICTTLCSFIVRTALVKQLGIGPVSLNGLFTEVIAMLSLTELGVGSAIVYNLYKPLAEGNYEKVSQLMNLFKKAYRVIALSSFVIGCFLIPWIHLIVNQVDYSVGYIRTVYFLFVIQTSTSYLFSYKISLLNADQKKYIHSIVCTVGKLVGTILLVVVLFVTKNYVLYLACNIALNLLTNAVTSCIVDRQYSYLNCKAVLPKEEARGVFKNVKDIFIKTVCSKITNSTDNILISTLVGTLKVGYYSNYAMFFMVVRQLEAQFGDGIAGSIGNLMTSDNHEHSIVVLKRLTFVFYFLASCGMLCLYAAISPFITIWLGRECVLENSIVFICCFNVFFEFTKLPLWRFLEVSGLFAKDRNISIIGTVFNLLVSVVLGLKIGMAGIFIGTLVTYVVQLVMKISLLFNDYFSVSPKQYYLYWLKISVVMLLQMVVLNLAFHFVVISSDVWRCIIYALLGACVALVCNTLVFCRSDEWRYMIDLLKSVLLRKK